MRIVIAFKNDAFEQPRGDADERQHHHRPRNVEQDMGIGEALTCVLRGGGGEARQLIDQDHADHEGAHEES